MNRSAPSMRDRHLGRTAAGSPRRQSGFSLLEVLMAAALLLTIALAILPLFVRATMNNMTGRGYTQMTTTGNEAMETYNPAEVGDPRLVIPVGLTKNESAQDFWVPNDPPMSGGTWVAAANEKTPWSRTVTIRQYQISDLDDNRLFDTPLDGNTLPASVQIKETHITIRGVENTAQAGRVLNLRYYRSF